LARKLAVRGYPQPVCMYVCMYLFIYVVRNIGTETSSAGISTACIWYVCMYHTYTQVHTRKYIDRFVHEFHTNTQVHTRKYIDMFVYDLIHTRQPTHHLYRRIDIKISRQICCAKKTPKECVS
jgi:hypothetical protein